MVVTVAGSQELSVAWCRMGAVSEPEISDVPDATTDARHRWHDLAERISDAQEAYYGADSPTLSDAEYDQLMHT